MGERDCHTNTARQSSGLRTRARSCKSGSFDGPPWPACNLASVQLHCKTFHFQDSIHSVQALPARLGFLSDRLNCLACCRLMHESMWTGAAPSSHSGTMPGDTVEEDRWSNKEYKKETAAPRIPAWSPTAVLTRRYRA